MSKKEFQSITSEFEETRRQIEEDADREIEQLKHEFEEKVAQGAKYLELGKTYLF